uniref:Uncharacterized protein n=1 Tax=Anguilla anguilla TaxID=7936 RepID=A0A0E9TE65_ANGAN
MGVCSGLYLPLCQCGRRIALFPWATVIFMHCREIAWNCVIQKGFAVCL